MAQLEALRSQFAEVSSLQMQSDGYGVWLCWADTSLHPVVTQTLEDYGGVVCAEDSGQVLWFFFTPDGKYIAYWQSNTEGTGVFDIINNVDSIYPTVLHFPYPKAGPTNSAVQVGYLPAEGGTTTWITIPGDPRNNYIPRMEFIPKSNELFIQQLILLCFERFYFCGIRLVSRFFGHCVFQVKAQHH